MFGLIGVTGVRADAEEGEATAREDRLRERAEEGCLSESWVKKG